MALKKSDRRPRILKAAFELASQKSLNDITLNEIAEKAELPVESLYGYGCNSTKDIIELHNNVIDEKVISQYKTLAENGEYDDLSERERLFDLMMLRMETLNETREGSKAILGITDKASLNAILKIPNIQRSMGRMLKTAGVTSRDPIREQAKILGLTAVYATALKSWSEDETEGLSKTMRSLDDNIKKGDAWYKKFNLN